MTTKTPFIEVFNLISVEKPEERPGTHKMTKTRKKGPYKLNLSKAILWFFIFLIAAGFGVMWYKLITKVIISFFG